MSRNRSTLDGSEKSDIGESDLGRPGWVGFSRNVEGMAWFLNDLKTCCSARVRG